MREEADVTKFLWTVLKQCELKNIKWDAVATELGISNGHAARMRFSRYKAQMEGRKPVPRGPRQKDASGSAPASKKRKAGDSVAAPEQQDLDGNMGLVKDETAASIGPYSGMAPAYGQQGGEMMYGAPPVAEGAPQPSLQSYDATQTANLDPRIANSTAANSTAVHPV